MGEPEIQHPPEDIGACATCGLPQRIGPCPFATIPLFWKVTIAVTFLLMLLLVLTSWSMSRTVTLYADGLTAIRVQDALEYEKLAVKVDKHMTATMENRSVQTEIRGLLTGYISEERAKLLREAIDKQIQADRDKRR